MSFYFPCFWFCALDANNIIHVLVIIINRCYILWIYVSLQAPHSLYKPNRNLITCKDPLCASLHTTDNLHCDTPEEQCDYEVQYADHGSSLGVLVHDSFPLRFTNGSTLSPRLAFGWIAFHYFYLLLVSVSVWNY